MFGFSLLLVDELIAGRNRDKVAVSLSFIRSTISSREGGGARTGLYDVG